MKFFGVLLISIIATNTFAAGDGSSSSSPRSLSFYESILPDVLRGPSERYRYEEDVKEFSDKRTSFLKSVSTEDAIKIGEYFDVPEFYEEDLSKIENELKEKFHPNDNALDFEQNLLRGYFALVRYDKQNDNATSLAFETALKYLRRYKHKVFQSVQHEDPIFLDVWNHMQERFIHGNFHKLIDTLAEISPDTSHAFLNTKIADGNASGFGSILTFMAANHRVDDLANKLNFEYVEKIITNEIKFLNLEETKSPSPKTSWLVTTEGLHIFSAAAEFFKAYDRPMLSRLYAAKAQKAQARLDVLIEADKSKLQDTLEKQINVQSEDPEEERLIRNITALLNGNIDNTLITDKNTGIHVTQIKVPQTRRDGNVVVWGKTDTLYRLEVKTPGLNVHQSILKVANELLFHKAGLYFDSYLSVPAELKDDSKYIFTKLGDHVLVRPRAQVLSCELLFSL